MPLVIADRVRESSTSVGTGTFTLEGAGTGYRAFSAVMAVNDTTYYVIDGGAEWEVGLGTYSAANTLTRTTVTASSNANAAVNFSAGTKSVFISAAGRFLLAPRSGITDAFQLQATTAGATAGGNARGTGAVDLQLSRSAATQVASGGSSFVAGSACTASNGNAVAMGSLCSASGQGSIAIGQTNNATGLTSVALGQSNTSSGAYSTVPGGSQATTNNVTGLLAYGFNGTVSGRNQMSFFGGRQSTTNASAVITADAAAAATTNQLTLRDNSAFRFMGRVVSRDTVTNDCKEWVVEGLIKRGAAAANTSLVGTPSVTSTFADTATTAWAVTVAADTTNGALQLTINTTGTANAVRTTAVVWSQEVA